MCLRGKKKTLLPARGRTSHMSSEAGFGTGFEAGGEGQRPPWAMKRLTYRHEGRHEEEVCHDLSESLPSHTSPCRSRESCHPCNPARATLPLSASIQKEAE